MFIARDVRGWFDELSVSRAAMANRALAVLSPRMKHAEDLGLRPEGSNPCRGRANGSGRRFTHRRGNGSVVKRTLVQEWADYIDPSRVNARRNQTRTVTVSEAVKSLPYV